MVINDDGNFYDYSTAMIQHTTVYYKKKHITKLRVIENVLYVHCKLVT
jgi:hypothetical protein